MTSPLAGRHYVVSVKEGARRHIVQRVETYVNPRTGRLGLLYITVSKHFTIGAALKAARVANRKAGVTH